MMEATGALVAGVAEEAGFRGYMQGPMERRYGPVAAILITGMVFGFAHFTHAEVTIAWLPFYVSVAAVYGALAYFTNSIFPSLVLHAGGNLLSSLPSLADRAADMKAALPLETQDGGGQPLWVLLLGLA